MPSSTEPGAITQILIAERVPARQRVVLAVLCGLLAAAINLQASLSLSGPRDFGPVWFAARAVLHGVNPYPLIGPGLAFNDDAPLVYPLTAALVAVPFAPLAETIASSLFVFIGAALFAWALMQSGYGPLFGFFSFSVRAAAFGAQWSMLFAAIGALPVLSWITAAKPTIGAALFAAWPRWQAIAGGGILTAIAFLVQPTWVRDWLHTVATYRSWGGTQSPYHAVVEFPAGIIALAALLRWRRPEARLIAALACVPISPEAYEMVPLFLVPRTFLQAATLAGLSYVQYVGTRALTPRPWTHATYLSTSMWLYALLLFLPCVVMVLRRPNEAPCQSAAS